MYVVQIDNKFNLNFRRDKLQLSSDAITRTWNFDNVVLHPYQI